MIIYAIVGATMLIVTFFCMICVGPETIGGGLLIGGVLGTFIAVGITEYNKAKTRSGQEEMKRRDEKQREFENNWWIKKD